MGQYDAFLDEEKGAIAPAANASPYDSVLDDEVQQNQQRVRAVFEKALAVNPDQAAQSKKLMNSTGLPLAVVERNLDEVKRKDQARMLDLARMAQDSPVLARQLMDPAFTNQAHDDISTLSAIGQFFSDTGGSMKAGLFNASKGSAGVLRAGTEFIAPVLDPLESVTSIGGNPLRRLAEGFAIQAQAAGATAKAAAPKTDGVLSGGFQSGIQSLTQNVLMLPMAFLPGGQPAALTGMVSMTGGQSYQDAREKGLSMSQALPFAASQAAIEYATEKMPLGDLIRDLKVGAPIMQLLTNQLKGEVIGEQVATVLQDLNEWAVLNPEKTFRSYLEERPNAAAQTLVATIVGTGGNVAIAKGVEVATKKLMGDAYDIGLADTSAEQLKQAMLMATDSKLRERNPEEFRTLVQKMADGTEGAPTEVFVDAEVLNQLAPEVLAQLPGVAAQMQAALAANDVISIPVADVLTVAPGTPLEAMLVEHSRVGDPRAMSQFEAKEASAKAQEFLAQESQRVIQQATDQQAWQESHDRVKQTILEGLNTVGRDRPAVNETTATLYAALYTTLAAELKTTPEQAWADHGVKYVGQTGQGSVLNAGGNAPVRVEADDRERLKLTDPGNPDIVLHTATESEDGVHMGAYLEVLDSPEKLGGKGTATRLYLKALEIAQSNGMGWKSESIASDATHRMYARLTALGIPFKTEGNTYVISPEALADVNLPGGGGMPGEMSVEGYHFSTADRTTLTTSAYGTGLKGSARDEILNHPDQRLKERLSFYFDKGTGIRPESGVGGRAHRVQLTGVYDADADPLKLRTGDARAFESKLLDLGYKGYANRMDGTQPGQVIMLGKQNFKPELLGALSQITNGQKVAPIAAAAPQWETQASGEPAMLEAKLARMQAMPAWAGYDLRVEGRELQVRKKDEVFEQSSKVKPGPDAPGVGLEDGNKLGFWPALRVKLTGKLTMLAKAPILTGTTNKNAAKQTAAIDGILKKFPKAAESTNEWTRMMAYALGSTEVPIPPYAFIRDLNGTGSLDKLRTLTQGQIDDATHGFENAAEFRRAYLAGELGVETTGKLFMWSFLSRGVSPYTQEALFIDAFNGADKWIAMAARGEFTEAVFPEYEEWAKSVAPKGSGQPGAGATHNLNAFGQDFLFKMSRIGEGGKTHMQRLHDMMADPAQTGKQIRREFATFGEGVGIDNKVVSFTLLVAGFPDVMVLDRVQIRQLWDDGRFNGVNLYDGVSEKRMVTGRDGKAAEKNVSIAGSSLNNLAEGVRGILVYEAIERGLEAKIQKLYADLGRPQDASIGRYHWETWVADSQQEASHGTLGAILADAKGDDQAIANVSAKQGEYGAYEYGALYNRDSDGIPWFGYDTPGGGTFAFSVPAFRAFLEDIKRPATGVVPTKFKVTESGNAPWYTRQAVNQDRLNERAAFWADRAGGSGEGQRAIEETLQQQAPDRAGSPADGGARINFEVAPDPSNAELTARWKALSQAQRLAASQRVAERIVPGLLKSLGAKATMLPQVGSYLEDTSPSFALILEEGDPSVVAKALGFALSQESMVVFGSEQFDGAEQTGAVRIDLSDVPPDQIDGLYQRLRAITVGDSQPVGGQSTSSGIMTVLNFSDVPTEQLAALVDQALGGQYDVSHGDIFAAFPENKDYDYASATNDPAGEEGLARQRARDARQEASAALEAELSQAGGTFEQANGPETLNQGPRGTFSPKTFELALNENSNMSTVHHEMAHAYLEIITKIASEPNAPQAIVDQVERFLKWQGISDLATWQAMTLDQKRPHHEALAENYEHYLLTGKAPSVELQPLFRKLKAYMLNAYRTLKAFFEANPDVNQKLPPEMVQFYDRMLASEEQIRVAEEVAGLVPNEDATAEAVEKLTARSLRDLKWTVNARNKEIKRLQAEAKELRKGIEEEVTQEVNQMPEYRAQAALDALQVNPDYTVAAKAWTEQRAAALAAAADQIKADLLAANPEVKGLQKGQLLAKNKKLMANQAEAKALEWEAQNPKPRKADNATDMDLATVADSFGYPDVPSMLQAIDGAGKKSDMIEGMADQRMLERHGDLIDPRAIEQAANEAVHNEARARSLATELRSQAEMLNPRTDTGQTNSKGSKITVNAIVEAAKQFAANVVARTPLKDLKAKAWQHTAAERRAGKRWTEATAAGKTQDAVKAKQDQVLNNAAAKAALDAQIEMRKILTFFKRVIKDNNEKVVDKGRDPDVVNAARAVLAAYGVAPKAGKTALEYMALVEKNDPAMFAALQPSVQGALNMAQPLDALTMEELRALHEEIQGMWHLAKRSRQMEVDGNMMDMQDAEDELQARMQTLGVPLSMPGDTGAVTPREELARKLQHAGSLLRRTEQWAQGMGAEFTRLVFQPIKDAANAYRADRVTYRKAYQALVDNVAPALTKGTIAAPELNYTFGEGHNGIGHAELLHAILHTGNASNKRKLLLGRGWATENDDGTLNTDRWDAFLQRAHDTGLLNKAHYDFAQGVWDLLEKTKPLAQKTHRDVFGRYFAEVTADSFSTPFGDYAGGYVPAQADPRIVQDADLRKLAEAENENMAFSFPGTNKGFTKGRVDYNRPLLLDLRTIGQHIDKVLLFSHMEPAVRDVQKLLSRKGVSYSLGRIDPTIYAGMLTPWLNRSARQVVETPIVGDGGISRVLSAARGRAGMALMFANVSNTIQQITGFSIAAIKVKPASMMRATGQFIAHPKQTAKAVSDASEFMANRMENEIAAINDAMDAILLDPSLYEKAQAWSQKHAYFMQTAMANTMEPIIWTAAYNDALTEGQSERDAVRHADSVIRTTQGSTLPEDVSRIETGPAYARVFTQFIGYFNMIANTNATALKQIAQEEGLKKGAGKAIGVVTLGMLIPIWVAEAIAQAMRGGPDDEDKDGYLDDWLMAVFGMGTLKGTFAMVPFIGQLANAGINRFNGNPADDKVSLSPAVSLLESAVGVPVDIYKAITGDVNKRNLVRDVASAVSIATGLPAIAVARPLGYLAGVGQGRINPTSAGDMARGLVTGTPSPESK